MLGARVWSASLVLLLGACGGSTNLERADGLGEGCPVGYAMPPSIGSACPTEGELCGIGDANCWSSQHCEGGVWVSDGGGCDEPPPVEDPDESPPPPSCGDMSWGDAKELFSDTVSGPVDDRVDALAADGKGSLLVGGAVHGADDVGGMGLAPGASGPFVARLSSAGGATSTRVLEGEGSVVGLRARVTGDVSAAGWFTGGLTIGGVTHTGSGLFVASLAADLTPGWSVAFTGADDMGDNRIGGLGTDSAGNTVVAAVVSGDATLGGIETTGFGYADLLIAKLDPGGQLLWVQRFGESFDETVDALSVGANDAILFAGTGTNGFAVGDLTVDPPALAGVFVVKLDADGKAQWATTCGGDLHYASDIAEDPSGTVWVTGSFGGEMSCGGLSIHSPDAGPVPDKHGFMMRLDAAGKVLSLVDLGLYDTTFWIGPGAKVAVDDAGAVLATRLAAPVQIGGRSLDPTPTGGTLLLRFTKDAELVAAAFGGERPDVAAVALDGSSLMVAGNYTGHLCWGTTLWSNRSSYSDGFVAGLAL